ncbi:tRNA-splicing endonuclease subunit Sen2 [Euwallacea similis]|uniref:tRNA-splicing endonuclease subunit Sen2 n=1 Tax=Euwallacea similis TaxID=1736056 RepID=UPI003450321B
MQLQEPKRKKYCKLAQDSSLPVILKKDESLAKITGYFNGFSVIVQDPDYMKIIISKGYFGKANFSRSYPQFSRNNQVKILRQRQFLSRQIVTTTKFMHEKVIVIPDSDSENEYFTDMRPKYEIDYSGLQENIWLGLEEAFFLASVVKCMDVKQNNEILPNNELWQIFKKTQPNFVVNYIIYYYYRAKNWVVKPGIKFGGDFLLYSQGPPFCHASYVIIIEVIDHYGQRIDSLTNRCMDNISILSLNRLCETSGKELLICQVKWPKNGEINYEDLSNIEIHEILLRRWIASQEKNDV